MGKDVIIALDFDSKEKTLAFLDRFTGKKPFVKIGMELFYAEGPSIVARDQGAAATRSSSISSCTTSPTPSKKRWPCSPPSMWTWSTSTPRAPAP